MSVTNVLLLKEGRETGNTRREREKNTNPLPGHQQTLAYLASHFLIQLLRNFLGKSNESEVCYVRNWYQVLSSVNAYDLDARRTLEKAGARAPDVTFAMSSCRFD